MPLSFHRLVQVRKRIAGGTGGVDSGKITSALKAKATGVRVEVPKAATIGGAMITAAGSLNLVRR